MRRFNNNLIGIFGGSFDPVHKGHLYISKVAIKKLNLKKLFWLITKKNPFKKKTFFSLNNRISKCKSMVKKNSKIKVKFLEKFTKSSRTIDNLNYIIRKNKNSNFFLIIGSDNLIHFHLWKSWKQIAKNSTLVVFSRKGFDKKAKKSVIVKHLNKENIIFVKNHKMNISSSLLRKKYLKKTSR